MDKKVRVGIIGCGGIANGKHMPSLKKIDNVEMVAFCDLIEEKAVKAAEEYGTADAKVYVDYKELLKDSTIDVVHVCTPNRSHSFITVDSLEAGKQVMCEKPMAKTYAEAKKMLDAAKRTGNKLTIGYQTRWREDALYLKRMCDEGELGDIYFAKAIALRRRAVPTWGVFLNEYEQGDWDIEKFTVEDAAFGFIVMENGATIILESSWALNIADPREAITMLCGDKAGADMFDGLRINSVKRGRQCLEKPDFDAGGVAFFDGDSSASPAEIEARAWINAVVNDTEPPTKPEQAIVVTQILEAIYESAKTGKPVYFDN